MRRMTLRGWFEYLDDPKRELTESEFMALMLFNTREYARLTMELVKQQKDATEHVEGMVGAIDAMLSQSNPDYPSSGAVREALDVKRDADRQLAAEQRRKALTGEETAA